MNSKYKILSEVYSNRDRIKSAVDKLIPTKLIYGIKYANGDCFEHDITIVRNCVERFIDENYLEFCLEGYGRNVLRFKIQDKPTVWLKTKIEIPVCFEFDLLKIRRIAKINEIQ